MLRLGTNTDWKGSVITTVLHLTKVTCDTILSHNFGYSSQGMKHLKIFGFKAMSSSVKALNSYPSHRF